MAENKTQPNDKSVQQYLTSIEESERRREAEDVCQLLKELSGEQPVMWGNSMVGFGKYRYRYASGREGEWMRIGFAVRKRDLTLYIMSGLDRHKALLDNLGRFKTGKSCLYIKRLADIDRQRLIELAKASLAYMAKTYPD